MAQPTIRDPLDVALRMGAPFLVERGDVWYWDWPADRTGERWWSDRFVPRDTWGGDGRGADGGVGCVVVREDLGVGAGEGKVDRSESTMMDAVALECTCPGSASFWSSRVSGEQSAPCD